MENAAFGSWPMMWLKIEFRSRSAPTVQRIFTRLSAFANLGLETDEYVRMGYGLAGVRLS